MGATHGQGSQIVCGGILLCCSEAFDLVDCCLSARLIHVVNEKTSPFELNLCLKFCACEHQKILRITWIEMKTRKPSEHAIQRIAPTRRISSKFALDAKLE